MTEQATKYESQLPKKKTISFSTIFSYFAGIASIFGFLSTQYFFQKSKIELAQTIFLLCLVSSIIIHTYNRDRRKLHRYAQAIFYIHYVNHIMRDNLAIAKEGNFQFTEITLQRVVDAIANCFGILTGKQCRCSIKELKDDHTITTVVRDSISKKRIHENQDTKTIHRLEENTDFKNLWYSIYGCSRFFLCNDLKKFWKIHKYENSSFKIVSPPRRKSFCAFTWVCNWKLPYKSTLVLPIRYFSAFTPPKQQDDPAITESMKNWKFWGFVCIDCNSTNIFDEEFAPELGAAFADILYIFNEQTKFILDNKK